MQDIIVALFETRRLMVYLYVLILALKWNISAGLLKQK